MKFYPDVIQVVIALEATSVYSFHLATFLSVAHFNGHIPAIVYSVNPKEIHAYKKTFTDVGKDDYVDAMVIAIMRVPTKSGHALGKGQNCLACGYLHV